MIALKRLYELLAYNPETGAFTWKTRHPNATKIRQNGLAGSQIGNGYIGITIEQKQYYAHRLAWFYTYGFLPRYIDHIDRCKTNNRIANLRPATMSQNIANSRCKTNSSSGYKGVTYHKAAKKWVAAITCNRQPIYLGLFPTPEQAHAAYLTTAKTLFGEFARAQ